MRISAIYLIEDIRVITVINRMRIFQKFILDSLYIHISIRALVIIFTVIIVQVGMDDDVDILGF